MDGQYRSSSKNFAKEKRLAGRKVRTCMYNKMVRRILTKRPVRASSWMLPRCT